MFRLPRAKDTGERRVTAHCAQKEALLHVLVPNALFASDSCRNFHGPSFRIQKFTWHQYGLDKY